ncbi:MAG TPA: HAMP domain-containing sensor histidine kinase, partial [Egibacteraceae bacterium]|nr:HAMP domain-containing sensor histidine kinase [Egibacteraceae bacterium]
MTTNGQQPGEPRYWGTDRRRTLADPEWSPRCLAVGGGLLIALFLAVNLAGEGLVAARNSVDMVVLRVVLEAAGAALAIVVGLLCVVRWRLSGEAAALWAGTALLTFGTLTIALTGLLPLVYEPLETPASWVRPASRLVAAALLTAAVLAPAVDARVRMGRLVSMALVGTAALAAAFRSLPVFAQHVAGAADAHLGASVSPYGPLFVTLVWSGLSVAFFLRAHRERRPLLSWLGLLLGGLALAELTRLNAAGDAELWSAGAHLLRLTGLSLGLVGATTELQRSFSHQSHHLMETVVSAAAAEARVRAGRHEIEERAHEARNALAAIDGASQTLERFRHQLSPDERTSLVSALSGEIARLRRLVSADNIQEGRAPFLVAEALAPVITGARTQGVGVLVDVDETLTAYGRWADLAEVVQNLFQNAGRYAPGSPVAVRARQEGDRVLVRVEDRGPGVPPDQREAIFRRGVRGAHTAEVTQGTGLGLYVAARLMHDQDGDLWLEDRPGGGAVFVAALPAAGQGNSGK